MHYIVIFADNSAMQDLQWYVLVAQRQNTISSVAKSIVMHLAK